MIGRYPHQPGAKRPGASQAAARSIAPHARTLRNRVHAEIQRSRSPQTADEIAAVLGEKIQSVRPRVSELHRLGKIEPAPGSGGPDRPPLRFSEGPALDTGSVAPSRLLVGGVK